MKTDTLKKMLLMLLCVVSVNMTALGRTGFGCVADCRSLYPVLQ